MTEYDSTADTLKHSRRVGELIGQAIKELIDRSTSHDLSKTEPPEKAIFDEYTPKLKGSTYGSEEYQGFLEAMGEGLKHHYAHNRHHPEFHDYGVTGMTLIDIIEMLADWKAATERHDDGSLARSLEIQKERFGISDQLDAILHNTARAFGWISPERCGNTAMAPDGTWMVCNVFVDEAWKHEGLHADGNWDGGQLHWNDEGNFR